MLLRRITEHIKSQNWFAVTLDFLIVVFGVFIGFQVDNWNEARKVRAQESVYLSRLYNDMEVTIRESEREISLMMKQGNRAGLVIKSLRECSLSESDRFEFANGFYMLGKLFRSFLVKGTIDELESTGKIDIIKNPNILEQLNRLIASHETRIGIMPFISARINPKLSYIEKNIAYQIESPHIGYREIGWDNIDLKFDELCEDWQFYAAMSDIRMYTYDVIAQNGMVLDEARKLHQLLEEEIKKNRNK